MISCLHDHFLNDQLLPTPHLYFLYFGYERFYCFHLLLLLVLCLLND